MLVNEKEVKNITGVDVTNSEIILAQHIIEAYVGKNESEIHGADDLAIMAKAVAFQAIYMQNNYDRVYQQVAAVQFAQVDSQLTLRSDMAAPWIAPLSVLSLRNLSWRRSRSVATGSMFGGRRDAGRWETT